MTTSLNGLLAMDDTGAVVGPGGTDFPLSFLLLGDPPISTFERFRLDRSSWDSFEVIGRASSFSWHSSSCYLTRSSSSRSFDVPSVAFLAIFLAKP